MRTVFLFFILFYVLQWSYSQHTIIYTQGELLNYSKRKYFEKEDIISHLDTIAFSTSDAIAVLLDTQQDTFLISFPQNTDFSKNIGFVVKDIIKPYKDGNFVMKQTVSDLAEYFGNNTFVIIGDSATVMLDAEIYPLNENQFIVFYYTIDNKQVAKKIGFSNQRLILEKQKLMTSKGLQCKDDALREIKIYQYEISSKKTNYITRINLTFIDIETLEKELSSVFRTLKATNMSLTERKEFLREYFIDIYGNTDMQNLITIIDRIVQN